MSMLLINVLLSAHICSARFPFYWPVLLCVGRMTAPVCERGEFLRRLQWRGPAYSQPRAANDHER